MKHYRFIFFSWGSKEHTNLRTAIKQDAFEQGKSSPLVILALYYFYTKVALP